MSFSKVKHFLNFFRSYFGKNQDVYANCYEIECDGLRILELKVPEYCILHWLTVQLQKRGFDVPSVPALEAEEYLLANFSVDYESCDAIIGYRADNNDFLFAQDFINGTKKNAVRQDRPPRNALKPETNLKLLRQKDINKAQAEYLVVLAKVLCCEAEDLMEKME